MQPERRDNFDVLILQGLLQSFLLPLRPDKMSDMLTQAATDFAATLNDRFFEGLALWLPVRADLQVEAQLFEQVRHWLQFHSLQAAKNADLRLPLAKRRLKLLPLTLNVLLLVCLFLFLNHVASF